MNKAIFIGLLFFICANCNSEPYAKHKLKTEKLPGDCNKLNPYFRLVSNIGGERFEFEKCLDAAFNENSMKVLRQGDTVVVSFEQPAGKTSLYKVTLDIDSYPRYNFITVDGETFIVSTAY